MDEFVEKQFGKLKEKDKQIQYEAFQNIMNVTKERVDWSYEVWDQLVNDLSHSDHHKRARAAQILSHLAISDPEKRMINDFPEVWEVTKDEKFVTARHALQTIWRIGLAGEEQKEMVILHLVDRFHHCEDERNFTLIRSDILQDLRDLYDHLHDEEIKYTAMEMIDKTNNAKYRKKYEAIWK